MIQLLYYLLHWNLAFVGLSVTEVVTCSIIVVIGTTLNYFLDGKINKAKILFPGVACFLIAVCLGSVVHSSNASDNKVKLYSLSDDVKQGEKAGGWQWFFYKLQISLWSLRIEDQS
ncbi:hypothetical protein UlMin_008639, partial [Ulmus minor]